MGEEKKMIGAAVASINTEVDELLDRLKERSDVPEDLRPMIVDKVNAIKDLANIAHLGATGESICGTAELVQVVSVAPGQISHMDGLEGELECQCDECVAARMQSPKNRMN